MTTFTPGQILFAAQLLTAFGEKLGTEIVGVANGLATLGADGKLPVGQLPAVAINDVFVVGSQAAMLALTAEKGDVALRTDLSKSYILSTNSPGTLADWKEVLVPAGGGVSSVAGRTGAVTLVAADISDAGATGKSALQASTAAVLTALLNTATTSAKGLAPQLSGDSNQYLNGVGSFATPPAPAASWPKGYLFPRALLSNNGTTPLSKIDIAAGVARSSDDTTNMAWGALTLDIATTGANGLDVSGTRASLGTVHVYVIYNPTTTTYAAFGSPSFSPTLPSGYTKMRRVGSLRLTSGSPFNVPGFVSRGDMILFKSVALESLSYGGGSPSSLTSIPLGLALRVMFGWSVNTPGSNVATFRDPGLTTAVTPTFNDIAPGQVEIGVNTSAQITLESGAAPSISVYAQGYIDPRDA